MDKILMDVVKHLKEVLPGTDWDNERLDHIWQTYVEYSLGADVTMTLAEYRQMEEDEG